MDDAPAPRTTLRRRMLALAGTPLAFGTGFAVLGSGLLAAAFLALLGSLSVLALRVVVDGSIV